MRGKKELFMLNTGLVLFIFDLVTDIVVAAQYRLKGEYWWFGFTLVFIIVPLFIISFMAAFQADFCQTLSCCLMFLCSSIFVRYVEEFKYWKQTHWDNPPCGDNYKECNCPDCEKYRVAITESNKSAYKLAWVRYVETLTESTPQWCLQIYIMLRQWDFPWLTMLSTVISLLSLAWSITALEKARVNKNSHHNFTLAATVVFFTSQLFSLLSRLFAIAAFAYVFKAHVFTALAVHWLMMNVVLWLADGCNERGCELAGTFLSYSMFTFLLMLHVPDSLTEGDYSDWFTKLWYSLISVENVLFAILALTIPTSDVKHMSVLRPIVLSLVILGVVLGTIFLIVYNKHLKPTEERREEPTEEPVV
ncbi:XK-related 6-like [Paramuricea clavata]|nr:XK-related 6-like [Paramuricea clavata]